MATVAAESQTVDKTDIHPRVNPMTRLDGKTVLVTGASGAIGHALCLALAKRGCALGLLGRRAEKLAELRRRLAGFGVPCSAQTADLRRRDDVHRAVARVTEDLGAVDVLVHNAGVGRISRPSRPQVEDVDEMFEVNYLGGVYAVEAVLPAMLARGSGHLAAVSSLAALRGMAFTAGYSASKAALGVFLEALRPALARRHVATTVCHLGFVRTPLSRALPLARTLWMVSAEQAAGAIIRAIQRGRREAFYPWYDALGARLARRLPNWMFDGLMQRFSRLVVKAEH